MAETDPASLKQELDLCRGGGHAGEDAAALIERLSRRIYAFHVKDMRADGSMSAVGAGTIDLGRLVRLPAAAAVRHFYVENDEALAPYLPDIVGSYGAMRRMRF